MTLGAFDLFKPRKWCLLDLVVGEDGKLVQTKVQSATFHFAVFAAELTQTLTSTLQSRACT